VHKIRLTSIAVFAPMPSANGNILECDGSGRRFGSPSEDELLRATKSHEGLSRLAYR
jgi:hypothetical protein